MCGICGVMSNYLVKKELTNFQQLMVLNVMRGWSGAGVAAVTIRGTSVLKTLETSVSLIGSGQLSDWTAEQGTISSLVGHTRWPTRGSETTEDHVHPHVEKPITGVHNGTMETVLRQKVPDNEKVSDSALLFKAFREHGVAETIKTSKGAYALVWTDDEKQTVNFFRNGERPLFFGAAVGAFYWASEQRMLNYIDPKMDVTMLIPNRWLAVPYGSSSTKAGTVTSLEYIAPKPPEPKKKHKFRIFPSVKNIVSNRKAELFRTTNNHSLFREEVEKVLMNGCVYCSKQATMADVRSKQLQWIAPTDYLCLDCATNPNLTHH